MAEDFGIITVMITITIITIVIYDTAVPDSHNQLKL